jgi:IstB-like ATP binding protein
MLEQPMIEKLLRMRLQGMADALKVQEQDPGARELRFVERLSLLVDQQWTWRENQGLARRLKVAKLRHNACIEDIDYRAARGAGKKCRSRSGEGLAVGEESREPLRSCADGRRRAFREARRRQAPNALKQRPLRPPMLAFALPIVPQSRV